VAELPRSPSDHDGDVAMVQRIRTEGFNPEDDDYEQFVMRAWYTAIGTLSNMIKDGKLGGKCLSLGWSLDPPPGPYPRGKQQDLVSEAANVALKSLLENAILAGEWSPEKSSLCTYYVNGTVIAYAKLHNAWVRQARVEVTTEAPNHYGEFSASRSRPSSNPEQVVIFRDLIRRALSLGGPKAREILWLRSLGYSTSEIAERMNLTSSAIGNRIYRLRQRAAGEEQLDPKEGE
jgi:sigma-70-like protein